jgi:hypothetical protein
MVNLWWSTTKKSFAGWLVIFHLSQKTTGLNIKLPALRDLLPVILMFFFLGLSFHK